MLSRSGSGGGTSCCSSSGGGGSANHLCEPWKSPPPRVTMVWSRMTRVWSRLVCWGHIWPGCSCFPSGVLDGAPSPLVGPIWRNVSTVGRSTQVGGWGVSAETAQIEPELNINILCIYGTTNRLSQLACPHTPAHPSRTPPLARAVSRLSLVHLSTES
jgi:hypothetical protein